MRGIIWYNPLYREEAQEVFDRIAEYYKKRDLIVQHKISRNGDTLILKNEDIWKLIPAIEQHRGQKSNVAYIQRSIPTEFIDTIIAPCNCALPWNAHRFFGESYGYAVQPNSSLSE